MTRLFVGTAWYVTVDAGMTSAANARVVREAGKHYLMALKENFHRLHDKAWVLLAVAPVKVRTRERVKGEWVERELRVVEMPPEEDFPDARQLVWVRQQRTKDGGLPKVETRLFLTSIPSGQLAPERMLTLVRRHWGIENGPNWTADVVLEEDTASPSLRGNAPLVLSWLRYFRLRPEGGYLFARECLDLFPASSNPLLRTLDQSWVSQGSREARGRLTRQQPLSLRERGGVRPRSSAQLFPCSRMAEANTGCSTPSTRTFRAMSFASIAS